MEHDRALWDLTGGLLAPSAVSPPSAPTGQPPTVEALGQARLSVDAGCLIDRSVARSAGTVTLGVPEGLSVLAWLAEGGYVAVRLGRDPPPDAIDQLGVLFPAGSWLRFDPPRLGDGSEFGLQFILPAGSTARFCGRGFTAMTGSQATFHRRARITPTR